MFCVDYAVHRQVHYNITEIETAVVALLNEILKQESKMYFKMIFMHPKYCIVGEGVRIMQFRKLDFKLNCTICSLKTYCNS